MAKTSNVRKEQFNRNMNNPWEMLPSQRKKARYEEQKESREKGDRKFNNVQNSTFTLLLSWTTLAGTIFGSTIALSTGRNVSNLFILGEFVLFLSVMFGAIYLWARVKGDEWSYFFETKMNLEADLNFNKDIMEDFEKRINTELIDEYKKLIMNNQKGILHTILKLISIDKLPNFSLITLLAGSLIIWFSTLDITWPSFN